MTHQVLYITGRGGDHTRGLGGHLMKSVENYSGLSMSPEFTRRHIDDQIAQVRQAITDCSGGTIVANSFGANLLLLALIDFDHDVQQVILLSPVLGPVMSKTSMFYSRPPASGRLLTAVDDKKVNLPANSAIYIGDRDEGYCPDLLARYAALMGADKIFLLAGEGHNLSKHTVQTILDSRLCSN